MKTAHRHELKQNAVALQVARARTLIEEQRSRAVWVGAAALVIVALAAGFWTWRQRGQEQAGAALADAMSVLEAEVTPADAARPPNPGAYASEQARVDAAIAKFRDVIARFPSSAAATTARLQAASLLVTQGKRQEAQALFKDVADRESGLHGRTARMALAELQLQDKQYDAAIATYRDLSAVKDGDLPVDGLLMQLGRAYQLAGKTAEALQTYQRVITEFPNSIYAADARKAADELKPGAGGAV